MKIFWILLRINITKIENWLTLFRDYLKNHRLNNVFFVYHLAHLRIQFQGYSFPFGCV